MVVFGLFMAAARPEPARGLHADLSRRLRLGLRVAEHAGAGGAARCSRRSASALPAQAGPHDDRRRRRARARRPRRRRRRSSRWRWPAPASGGEDRDGRGRDADRRRRGSRWPARCASTAASTRRSRSLLLTYIAIAVFNQLVEGPLRDPASLNKPSTTPIGEAEHARAAPRPRRALGPRLRRHHLPAAVRPRAAHHVRLRRCASSAATRAPRGWPGCRSAGSSCWPACSAARRRGWPAWSRWRRSTAAPTPRSSPATAMPASWSRSSRARTRSRSCRSPCWSAASPRAAACCSAACDLPDATVLVLQGMAFMLILAERGAVRPAEASSRPASAP